VGLGLAMPQGDTLFFFIFIFWLSAPDEKLLCMRKNKDFKTSGFYDNTVSKEDEMTTFQYRMC